MAITNKVLIISYYWPPSGGGGVQRWLKFSKYLPDYDWEPYVYTPMNPTFSLQDIGLEEEVDERVKVVKRKIWEPYGISGVSGNKGINESKTTIKNKLAKWVRANILLPDPRLFWIKGSVSFLQKIIEEENIKVIITTGPPHSMHLIGAGLKSADISLKWIADFRDPMVQFNFYQKLNPSNWALKRLKRMERKILQLADRVLATSTSTKDVLEKFDHTKYHTITNGWDLEDFQPYKDQSNDNEKYVLLHPGSLKSDRSPIVLFEILDAAIENDLINALNFELRLVGNIDESVINDLREFEHLSTVISFIDYVSHEDLINIHYAQANGLLLLINNSDSSKANIPGKLFEYMAVQKPIMAFGAKDDDAIEILEKVKIKTFRYDDQINYEDLQRAMEMKPQIDFQKYNRKALTADLVEVLNDLIREQ